MGCRGRIKGQKEDEIEEEEEEEEKGRKRSGAGGGRGGDGDEGGLSADRIQTADMKSNCKSLQDTLLLNIT